jgi:hypothetical protein
VAGVLLAGFLLSQVFPSFSTFIGASTGNSMILGLSGSVVLAGLILALGSGNIILDQRITLMAVMLLFVAPTSIIIGNLAGGALSTRVITDLSRPLLLFLFILGGYVFAYRSGRAAEDIETVIKYIFLLNVLLLFIFIFLSTRHFLIEIYVQRRMGGMSIGAARFAGTWNYPYNLTYLIVPSVLLFFAKAVVGSSKKERKSIFALFVFIMSGLMVLFIQSRSATISFLAGCLLAISLLLVFALRENNIRYFNALISIIIVCASIAIFSVFRYVHLLDIYATRFRDLFFGGEFQDFGSRIGRLEFGLDFISSDLFVAFFGSPRDSYLFEQGGTSFESFFSYIAIYGLIGALAYVLIPLLIFASACLHVFRSAEPQLVPLSLFGLGLVVAVIVQSMGTQPFLHNRFIPFFGFIFGFMLFSRKNT